MIHETAWEFLISDDLQSGLAIRKRAGHAHLSSTLIKYLSSDIFKQQREKRQDISRYRGFSKPSHNDPLLDDSLLCYASCFVSEHIYRSSSEDDRLMEELCDFLKSSNVLSWIEYIATLGDLNCISTTAINLRRYLGRRTKYVPPTDQLVYLVEGWVTDLIRVAAEFRSQLLACPSSIHCLVPPLCPPDSMISRCTKDARYPGLIVKGLPSGHWDDCLIRMDFDDGHATAICYGHNLFAV